MTEEIKLVVICGPTATGKTATAVKLCRMFNGEIISADSRQIYKDLDIGSGRGRVTDIVPIHLYNLLKPSEQITVVHFRDLAQQKIIEILSRGKIPFLVGGTGFYIQAILGDNEIEDIPPNPKLREALELLSLTKLGQKLQLLNSEVHLQIDQKNKRRLIRAIEREEYRQLHPNTIAPKRISIPNPLMIGLTAERDYLDKKIDRRTEKMIQEGLLDEVRLVLLKYGSDAPALDAIGYRQFIPHLFGEQSLEDAVLAKNTAEHQYAKRQITWFKRDERINWFDIGKREKNPKSFEQNIEKLVKSYISHG